MISRTAQCSRALKQFFSTERTSCYVSATCTKQPASACVEGSHGSWNLLQWSCPFSAGEFGQYFTVEEGLPPSLSSRSAQGFELKTAAYTVKTHADLIPFLKAGSLESRLCSVIKDYSAWGLTLQAASAGPQWSACTPYRLTRASAALTRAHPLPSALLSEFIWEGL